jgi:hypothetical protein
MKYAHLCWIPHQLTNDLRQLRVAKCCELLRLLGAIDEIPQMMNPAIGTVKFMQMAFGGQHLPRAKFEALTVPIEFAILHGTCYDSSGSATLPPREDQACCLA